MKATYTDKLKPSLDIAIVKDNTKTQLKVNASSSIAKAKYKVITAPSWNGISRR